MDFSKPTAINFQKIAAILIIVSLSIFLLIEAQTILKPVVFSIIFSLMLRPLCNWYDRWIPFNLLSVIFTFLTAALPLLLIIYIFFVQFQDVMAELPSIQEKLKEGFKSLTSLFEEKLPIPVESPEDLISGGASEVLTTVQSGLTASTALLASIAITLLYTFFMLLYRKSFKHFILSQFGTQIQDSARTVLRKIQKMNERYLYGMLIVMLLLSLVNSIGLWLIGLQYPFFWGFLGGALAIIPYLGTLVGGLLPLVYSLTTTDSYWQPLAILIFYFIVQQVEGNIITPKIVGSSVKVNPLAAIFSLILGGYIWGIAGAILAIPMVAIFRIIFSHIDILKPYGLLLSSDFYNRPEVFEEKYVKDRYRLFAFFRKKK